MQVYGLPEGLEPPDFTDSLVDGRYDMKRDDEVHAAFFERVKEALIAIGYTGPLTGEIVRFPIADGNAAYMVADRPRGMALIHLPVHDAWQIPDAHARGLRKADIVAQVTAKARWAALFTGGEG
jgi:hypothetical protein